jgi:hypothetical protein
MKRIEKTQTVDFVAPDKSIAYQTSKIDTNNIAQLGAANATTALAAANVMYGKEGERRERSHVFTHSYRL